MGRVPGGLRNRLDRQALHRAAGQPRPLEPPLLGHRRRHRLRPGDPPCVRPQVRQGGQGERLPQPPADDLRPGSRRPHPHGLHPEGGHHDHRPGEAPAPDRLHHHVAGPARLGPDRVRPRGAARGRLRRTAHRGPPLQVLPHRRQVPRPRGPLHHPGGGVRGSVHHERQAAGNRHPSHTGYPDMVRPGRERGPGTGHAGEPRAGHQARGGPVRHALRQPRRSHAGAEGSRAPRRGLLRDIAEVPHRHQEGPGQGGLRSRHGTVPRQAPGQAHHRTGR